jgi:acetylornithine deacetylase/succinyl-diaminopimelate desuccinylase-like protein
MRRIGLQNVKLIETPGNPVGGDGWARRVRRRSLLRPLRRAACRSAGLWHSPPFEATIRDGEIYAAARPTTRDSVHALQGGRSALEAERTPPVNMKFMIEGEEEVGSEHLDDFVRSHKKDLSADVVVISDSPMFARGVPSICYGLRGLVYFQLDLRGSNTDLHSGSFGGAVANPALVLAQMLAQMKDRGGRIKIPGFYDDVVPLREEERQEWARLPFNEKQYRKDFGILAVWRERLHHTRTDLGFA